MSFPSPRPGLEAAEQVICTRYADKNLQLRDLCEASQMPANTLTRCFQSKVGLSPMRALWRHRCDVAQGMIELDPAKKLSEVAEACGFQSQAHFTRRMKVHLKQLPGQYRRRLLQDQEQA